MADFYASLIPPFKTKKQKMALLQEIVRPKCADLLRANGFVCYKDEDLSWYRIAGGEVLQAVYFYTEHPRIPLLLRFGFACHPLFFEPYVPHPLTVNSQSYRSPLEMIDTIYQFAPVNPALEMNENRLIATLPNEGELMLLEKYLLPLLNEVQTEELAYKRQRDRVIKNCSRFGSRLCARYSVASFCFAEEAVYMGDEEMYPLCEELALREINSKVWCTFDAKMQFHAEQMLEYFETGDRAKYMQLLEESKQNTRKLLKKKLNI